MRRQRDWLMKQPDYRLVADSIEVLKYVLDGVLDLNIVFLGQKKI